MGLPGLEPSLPAGNRELPEPTVPALLPLTAPISWSKHTSRGHISLVLPGFRPEQHRFWHSLDVQDTVRAGASNSAQQDRKVRRHSVACK